jgi:hypothetical protein
MMSDRSYTEHFDQDSGGWCGWASNSLGPKPLSVRDSCLVSQSPWWIDYNHAPPGAGYLHLLAILLTRGPFSEHHREVAGPNRFVVSRFGTDFTDAVIHMRVRGELELCGARLHVLVQAVQQGICSGWLLTGQSISVTREWAEPEVRLVPDESQWTPLGSRHDRTDFYGEIPLKEVLADVNANILLVLYPLHVVPMGMLEGDPHRLRPEKDYPVWRHRLPEGYVMMDSVEFRFAQQEKESHVRT